MTLLGSHFLHPDRTTYGKLTFSVELLYANNAPSGFGLTASRARVQMCLSKGAKVALRVDYSLGQSLPPEDDDAAVSNYVDFCQRVATDPILGLCDWLICGNEPNLPGENREMGRPMAAAWVARCVYGHSTDSAETNNVYQYVRTANPSMQVLLPAVAPFSPAMAGDANMPTPIDGRQNWAPWESYDYALWEHAYANNWHADLGEVKGAKHTYGASGIASIGPGEPFVDVREPGYGAQFGTRWLTDSLWLSRQAQKTVYGSEWAPWVLVSECNIYRPPQTPRNDYPTGWWRQVKQYVDTLPNVMGLAAFVDQNFGGIWADTAMTSGLGRCPQWDFDHDWMLRNG